MGHEHRPQKQIVLLVHGTFAGAEENVGDAWWQEGSQAWSELRDRLPPEISVPEDKEVFHWSGDNGERARHEGAQLLLERLIGYEKQGRAYHLIGHSHGGSVIWNALKESVLRRSESRRESEELRLQNLRSWATVGTPFLQFRGTGIGKWYGRIVTLLTFMLSLAALFYLYGKFSESNEKPRLELRFDLPETPSPDVSDSPTGESKLEVQLGTPPDDKSLKGAGDASQIEDKLDGMSDDVDLLVQHNKWTAAVLATLMVIAAPLVFSLYFWMWAARIEARTVAREFRATNQAIMDFGDRWLGLWASEDEAISGLKASLKVSGAIFPRVRVPERYVFRSDGVLRFHRALIRWVLAPIFNRMVAPRGDGLVWGVVSSGAQGIDRPGCALAAVTEGPVAIDGFVCPHLPDELNQKVIQRANEEIKARGGEILKAARKGLSLFAWGAKDLPTLMQEGDTTKLKSGDLVHTSYFDHSEIIDLLADHAKCAHTNTQTPNWGASWISEFKQQISKNMVKHASVTSAGLPKLGAPNILALAAFILWISLPVFLFASVFVISLPGWWTIFPLLAHAIGILLAVPASRNSLQGALRGRFPAWVLLITGYLALALVLLVCLVLWFWFAATIAIGVT